MPDRPIIDFIRDNKIFRKILFVGLAVGGVYFLGVKMGWWQLTVGG